MPNALDRGTLGVPHYTEGFEFEIISDAIEVAEPRYLCGELFNSPHNGEAVDIEAAPTI